MKNNKKSKILYQKYYPSLIPLLIANSIPLIGLIFFNWNSAEILFYYALENIPIGFYTVLKMIKVGIYKKINIYKVIGLILVFMIHYSGFVFGHLLFVIIILSESISNNTNIMLTNYNFSHQILMGLLFYFFSHGISFKVNFIDKEEYKKYTLKYLFTLPYNRIAVVHISIFIVFFTILIFKLNFVSLLAITLLKLFLDPKFHIRERLRAG